MESGEPAADRRGLTPGACLTRSDARHAGPEVQPRLGEDAIHAGQSFTEVELIDDLGQFDHMCVNMAEACAVNSLSATVTTPTPTPTTPTAYCGQLRPPAPYNAILYNFTFSVATNGTIRGNAFALFSGQTDGDTYYGKLSGSNFTATSVNAPGTTYTGTVANGTLTISGDTRYGFITGTGTTSACN